MSNNRLFPTTILVIIALVGSGLGYGIYRILQSNDSLGSGSFFSVADQRYKEARDLESSGELILARLKYSQARDLYERQGNQEKLNQSNEGINRSLKLAEEFPLDNTAMATLLTQKIANYSANDFNNWELKGLLNYRYIDGQKRYYIHSVENMAFQDPQIAQRYLGWNQKYAEFASYLTPYILANSAPPATQIHRNPLNFRAHIQVSIDYNKLAAYQTVRCWLPFPIISAAQNDVQLLNWSASSATPFPAQPDQEIGVIYTELKNTGNSNLDLNYDLGFRTFETYFQIEANSVGTYDQKSTLYKRYTQSEPHLENSETLADLASKIVGNESNAYLKAQKIYNWISENIQYNHTSYPLVLSSSASHFALDYGIGDSTVQAFLFVALCRSSEIPARVVGGYQLVPGSEGPWTWAEFLLPNYGWVPVDTAMAQTVNLSPQLTSSQKTQVRNYYFGHLDPYRLNLNQTAPANLSPTKVSERNLGLLIFQPEAEAASKNVPTEAMNFTLNVQKL